MVLGKSGFPSPRIDCPLWMTIALGVAAVGMNPFSGTASPVG